MKKILLVGVVLLGTIWWNVNGQVTPVITQVDTFAIKGMSAQPVLKITINTGSASFYTFDKVTIKSLCQDLTDVDSVGLYITNYDRFSLSDFPGEAKLMVKKAKFKGDTAFFNCSNYPLKAGNNYVWVVMDLSKTAREFHYLDASIRAGGITVSGFEYPATTQSPNGQVIIRPKYFRENFESYVTVNGKPEPAGWTQVLNTGSNARWLDVKGGYGVPDIVGSRNPNNAKSGGLNARLAKETVTPMETWLVSSPIDLSLSVKPLLTFYNAQMAWCMFGNCKNDILSVYYKLGSTGTWKILKSYTLPTPDDGSWIKREILLPSEIANSQVYLGFKGTAQYGWGTCVDSVMLYETASVPRAIQSVITAHPMLSYVPQGTTRNPILRTNIRIKGNIGTITLNSITATSSNTSDNDILPGGVKLYYTVDSVFDSPVLLGTGQSFSGSKVSFTGLNKVLETGENYFWITYDLSNNAVPGNYCDIAINTGDIAVSGVTGTFPAITQNPAGQRQIKQNVFFDDFQTDKGWTVTGDFQRSQPTGIGGGIGFPDPANAYSNSFVLGNDLTGLGSYLGNYEPNITYAAANTATSPLIPGKYFKNTQLSFLRWLNVDIQDSAIIEYRYANESNWKFLWKNTGMQIDSRWANQTFNTSNIFDRKDLYLRYRLGPTNTVNQYSGWNVDYLFITGDSIKYDAAVSRLISPKSSCGLTSTEHFTVRIKNSGPKTLTNVPVKLSINGGNTWITENIPGPVVADDSVDYTFIAATDLSRNAVYNIIIKAVHPLDDYKSNDSITYRLTSIPTYNVPSISGFEKDTSLWVSGGLNVSWTHGTPHGYFISSAGEGTKSWKTDYYGRHKKYEYSYLESPCYNLSSTTNPMVDFLFSHETALRSDGAILEYTIDNGASWQYLPKDQYTYNWPWYNDTIYSLKRKGFTGQTTYASYQIWLRAKQTLPTNAANKANVRFRYVYKSDSTTYTLYDGFAFDNFRVHNAPFDAGVTSIDNIGAIACSRSNPSYLKVSVKNFGIRNMVANDTMIIGIKINNNPAVIDTIKLSAGLNAGQTTQFTLSKPVNLNIPGSYKVSAFTLIEKDPYYYASTSNDTFSISSIVRNLPPTGLKDTIYSARPDTIKIQAIDSMYFSYAWLYPKTSYTLSNSLLEVKNTGDGKHYLTVTNTNTGCAIKDSVYVKRLFSNAGITNVVAPVSHCAYGPDMHPVITIKNFGTDTLRMNQVIPVTFRLNSGSDVVGQIQLPRVLKPDSSYTATLAGTLDLSVPGTYQFIAFISLPNDTSHANDTIKNTFTLHSFPTVNLGADKDINGDNYTIDAGAGFSSYLWNTGQTTQTLFVDKVGDYSVTVTNANGCPDRDTVNVHLKIHDIGLRRIISPVNSCPLLPDTAIVASLVNTGTENIATTETITMSYSIDGGAYTDSVFNLSQALVPGDSIIFMFKKRVNFGTKKNYNLNVACHLAANDLRPGNDTIKKVVSIFGNPIFDLGKDSVINVLEHNLTPGAGYTSYLWQDNSTAPNYLITATHKETSQKYKVTVVDVNGCSSKDSVNILLDIKNMGIKAVYLPSASCTMAPNEDISVKVINLGDSTLVNRPVTMSYMINNGTPVTETLYFKGVPGHDTTFTFTQKADLSGAGTYKFYVSLQMNKDVQATNDTISQVVLVTGLPVINFAGVINDTLVTNFPHTLDAGSGTGYTYVWSTGSTTQTIDIANPGTYAVTVTNMGACGNSREIEAIQKVPDMAVTGFNVPLSSCTLSATQQIGIELTNKGNNILASETVTIKYQINGGAEKTKVVSFTGAPNQKNTFTFDETADMSAAGTYEFLLSAVMAGDNNALNNSKNYSAIVHGIPTIGFTDTVNVDLPYTIDAGAGTGYTYKWNTGATTQSIDTYLPGWFKVTVTNAGSCISRDSVFVRENTLDLSIAGFTIPLSGCASANNIQPVGVIVKNTGNLNFENQFVTLRYQLNGGIVWTKSVLFSGIPGESSTFTFDEPVAFSSPGLYNFMISLSTIGDGIASNNIGNYGVSVSAYPVINFGDTNDTLKVAFPYTIDAGSGAGNTYLWNTGATTQTTVLNAPDWYKVTVTGSTGCSISDSVYVYVPEILDLGVSGFTVPLSACILPNNQQVGIEVTNYGYDLTNQDLVIKYQINGGIERTKNVSFTGIPNSKASYTFDDLADLSVPGIYKFKITLACASDAVSTNDTITYVVNVHGFPTPSLGENRSEHAYTYTIDPGIGYVSYQWQDNSTDSVYIISKNHIEPTEMYWVTVTDIYGCQGTSAKTIIVLISDDLEVNAISLPSTTCTLTNSEPVRIAIKNTGNTPVGSNRIIRLKYQVNNGPFSKIDTLKLTADIAKNATVYHTFKQTLDMSAGGTFSIRAYLAFDMDVYALNDSLTLNYLGAPVVNFGATNDTIKAVLPYTLDAGAGVGYQYLWNDNSTQQTLMVTNTGLYAVTVTNASSCQTIKSVYVQDRQSDLGISGFLIPPIACGINNQQVSIEITNTGTTTISNESLTIRYSMNSGPAFTKMVAFSGDPGTKASFTFNETVDLSVAGNFHFDVSMDYSDLDLTNNAQAYDITSVAVPVISFGASNDTINVDPSYILDAGAGYKSYLWQDNSTTQTYTVAQSGLYAVTVTDNNNCTGSGSIYVAFTGIHQINEGTRIDIFPNPAHDRLYIKLKSRMHTSGYALIEIFSAGGQLVLTKKIAMENDLLETIDVSKLSKGLYHLRIYSDDWYITEKIIIQ